MTQQPNESGSASSSGPSRGTQKRPPLPKLTDEQRREAYSKSLELRRKRAELKEHVRHLGWPGLVEWIWHEPEAQGMTVRDLLLAIPRVGPKKADSLLSQSKIPANRKVQGCRSRQTERLFALLKEL